MTFFNGFPAIYNTIFYCYNTILCLYLYICMSNYVYLNVYCIVVMHVVGLQGPPGMQPLAEGGYPVEIKVNNNDY